MTYENKSEKSVALLELGAAHAECLHTQIHYLTSNGYRVHLICDNITWTRIKETNLLAGVQIHSADNSLFHQFALLLKIHFYIRQQRISRLVFNTTEINVVRNLFLISFPKILNITGILHNAEKLVDGRSIRYIVGKRMQKFFLLSEYLKEKFEPLTDFKLSVFYPVYFPPFTICPIEKSTDEFWITIPGGVNPTRKDYTGLLTCLLKEVLHPKIKLIFLGASDARIYPEIDALLAQTKLRETQILTFTGFVEYDVFHSYIAKSDLIMPLIHPYRDGFYRDSRISGAFNLSFAYKIPLLVEESMQKWTDLQGAAFYYRAENIVQVFNSLIERKLEVEQMKKTMAQDCRWKEEHLMRKYLEFIEL
ncbi:MAG: hypothetical protein LBD45_02420 [Bacteroidales bacterium]|jgi:hypothetical protein|nr:hypothetical protein [Bacteroidales bacterium]